MKKNLLNLLLLFISVHSFAQVTSIRPDTAYRGQTLRTYITVATGVISLATAPMNYNDIYFKQGTTIIYANPSFNPQINVYGAPNYTDSLYADFSIPANTPIGAYDVHVVSYTLTLVPVDNVKPNGMLIRDYIGTIEGDIYYDANQNGTRNAGEFGLSGQQVQLNPGGMLGLTDANGHYKFYTGTTSNTVSYLPSGGFTQTSAPSTYNFTVPPSRSGADFGVYISPTNLYAQKFSIWAQNMRCNSTGYSSVNFCNNGFATENGSISLIHSSNLPYKSSSKTPDNISGDTVHWSYSGYNPGQCLQISVQFQDPAAGQTVWYKYIDSVYNTSGVFQYAQADSFGTVTVCSYDPNDKLVRPEGSGTPHYTLKNDWLTYTVNFQNTGNDTALFITVYDTLDSHLDLTTFEVLASSHAMNTQRNATGAVRFTFENIYLPDSNIDEPHSHGWFIYHIKPKTGLTDNTVVYNKAYIVFDYNTPVITNQTFNTLTTVIPVNINTIYSEKQVILYPNPSDGNIYLLLNNPDKKKYTLTVNDLLGRTIAEQIVPTGIGPIKLHLDLLPGIYSYRLTASSGESSSCTGMFIIQ